MVTGSRGVRGKDKDDLKVTVSLHYIFLLLLFLNIFFAPSFLVGTVTEGHEVERSEPSGRWRKISRPEEKGKARLREWKRSVGEREEKCLAEGESLGGSKWWDVEGKGETFMKEREWRA